MVQNYKLNFVQEQSSNYPHPLNTRAVKFKAEVFRMGSENDNTKVISCPPEIPENIFPELMFCINLSIEIFG